MLLMLLMLFTLLPLRREDLTRAPLTFKHHHGMISLCHTDAAMLKDAVVIGLKFLVCVCVCVCVCLDVGIARWISWLISSLG